MITLATVVEQLEADVKAEDKAYRASHDEYMAATKIESKISQAVEAAHMKFIGAVSGINGDEETVRFHAKNYADAVLSHKVAKATTKELLEASQTLRATHTAYAKLSAIKHLRHYAFRLRELGIEPVAMLEDYGLYTERNPVGPY